MNSTYRKPKTVAKRKVTVAVLAGAILLHAAAFSARAARFATSGLEGIWDVRVLMSGDAPQDTGWYYGTQSYNAYGDMVFTSITRSDGDSSLPAGGTITLSPSGVVTAAGTHIHGIMNPQKNTVAVVMTDGRGDGYALGIMSKRDSTAYSTSDLGGTWNYVGLISGDAPVQKPGWYWGAFTFDEDGDLTGAAPVIDSLGNSDWVPSGPSFDISPAGVVTDAGGAIRGVMNSEKDMIAAVGTMCPGRDTAVCGYNLLILMKESTASFSIADLKGTWEMHMLTSGDAPQYTGWACGTWIVDDSGSCTVTSMTRSNADSTLPPGPVTMAISSSGLVTMPGSDFHGIMNPQKNMFVAVMTDGGHGYDLIVYIRGPRTISDYTFASCSATFANEYGPAAVGDRWSHDGFGAYSGRTRTVEAVSTEVVYGVDCLKLRVHDSVDGVTHGWLAEDMQGNIHIFRSQHESQAALEVDSDDDIPNIHMIGSPQVGDTWSRDFDGVETAESEVLSLTASTVGYDDCLKIRTAYGTGPEVVYEYFKEGVGLVKSERAGIDAGYVLVSSEPACPFKVLGDLNGDCKVDSADLALMADNWLVDCLEAPDDHACIPQ